MKKTLLLLLLFVSLLSLGMAQTTEELTALKQASPLFQSKYYKSHVWDVQRSPVVPVAEEEWNLSGFKEAYDASTFAAIDWGEADDRYLMFDLELGDTGSYSDDLFGSENTYNVVLKLFEADGTFVKNLCSDGAFMGFGDKGFLFNQNSRFGTFFTNDSYEKDASLTYTPATGVLTLLSELRSYRFSPQLLKPAGLLPNSVYNGKVQSIPLAPNEAYTITGTLLAERAGQYSVTVRLKDKENTSWSDGTTDDVYVVWRILKADYDMSAVAWDYTEPFIWDGTPKTVTLTGLPEGVSAARYDGNTATEVGKYWARVVLVYDFSNYNPVSVPDFFWDIKRLSVERPVPTVTSFVYNGEEQGIDIPLSEYYEISGTTSSTRVGNYTVYVSLNNRNLAWADGGFISHIIEWTIEEQLATSLTPTVGGKSQATVYPNPLQAGNSLLVEMGAAPAPGTEVQVLNLTGSAVRANIIQEAGGYRITELTTPGIYFVRISSPHKSATILKVLVQ